MQVVEGVTCLPSCKEQQAPRTDPNASIWILPKLPSLQRSERKWNNPRLIPGDFTFLQEWCMDSGSLPQTEERCMFQPAWKYSLVCYSFSVYPWPLSPESSITVEYSVKVLRLNVWTVEELLKKPYRTNEAGAGNSWHQPAAHPGVPPCTSGKQLEGARVSQVNSVVLSSLHIRQWIPRHLVSHVDSFFRCSFQPARLFLSCRADKPSEVIKSRCGSCLPSLMSVHCPVFRLPLGRKHLLLPMMKTVSGDLMGCLFLLFLKSCFLTTRRIYLASPSLSSNSIGWVLFWVLATPGALPSPEYGITAFILPTVLVIIFFILWLRKLRHRALNCPRSPDEY